MLEFAFPKGSDGTIRFEEINENLPNAHGSLSWVSSLVGEGQTIFGQTFSYCDAVMIPMLDYLDQIPEPFNILTHYPNLLNYLQYHRAQPYAEGVLGPQQ